MKTKTCPIYLNELINGPFNIAGHIGSSCRQGKMNNDVMKHPNELNLDPDSNPQPLVRKASMLSLAHEGGPQST